MTATAAVRLDYFYGTEDKMCSFYRIPKAFEKNEAYRNVSLEIKYLYSIMLDRVSISARNGWLDAGRVFIYFSLSEVVKCIQTGKTKALQVIREMEKLGLIQRKKQGQGRPARIFVKNIIETDEEKTEQQDTTPEPEKADPPEEPRRQEHHTNPAEAAQRHTHPARADSRKAIQSQAKTVEAEAERNVPAPVSDPPQDMALPRRESVKPASHTQDTQDNDTKRDPHAGEVRDTAQDPCADQARTFRENCAQKRSSHEPQTAGFRTSRLPESEPLDVQIPDPNYHNQNKTDPNYHQSIYPDAAPALDRVGRTPSERWMDMMEVRAMIRDNIDYSILARECTSSDMERIDQYVELMVQSCCSTRDTIRINGGDLPQIIVRGRFEKLNREHLLYVLECMKNTTTQVRNIRAYTLSALYNAYDTMEAYYDMQVQHDMAEWGVQN